MPKNKTLSEPELHAMIAREAKVRLGCAEFAPQFSLYKGAPDPHAQWPANCDVQDARNVAEWKPDCAQAFKEAVARARRKFDIVWK